jgi:Glucosidase II beta subunit-like protein
MVKEEAAVAYAARTSEQQVVQTELDGLNKIFAVDARGDQNEDHEMAMLGLFGECFEKQITQYRYKLCWMEEMKQGHTLLGKYKEWKVVDDLIIMEFKEGEKCWGAGLRRLAVLCCFCWCSFKSLL